MQNRTYTDQDPRTLTPWANNSKTHSPEQVQQIARSMSEFGFTKPVVIDETGTVLAGHGARLAALELNLPSVPCVCITGLSQEQKSAFERPWAVLKGEWDQLKGKPKATRSYFDNAHQTMRDVWEFGRVVGDERHGHATPKPVEMMERVMKTSLPRGGLCVEPFGGSGSTLMGAERTGRKCYTMELTPAYVDIIVRRWQEYTGREATHEDGETFATIEANS